MTQTSEVATQQKQALTTKQFFDQKGVQDKFNQLLGKHAQQFITSVLQIVASSDMLKNADPSSVYNAAATAAAMNLPLNQNLGFAYIIPFNDRKQNKTVAQFQMGYKGFVQLAQRSGQYETINTTDVREGEIKFFDRMTGELKIEWDQTAERINKPIVGYMAYFKLLNGFSKSLYMTKDDLVAHGMQYSQTYKKGFGMWKDNFEAMASKTVTKLLLSKYGPLSIDMQKAVITDQAIIKDENAENVEYVDHEVVAVDKELQRFQLMLNDCKTTDECQKLEKEANTPERLEMYELRMEELTNGGK